MPNTVLILHGWSDTYDSFRALGDIISRNGYPIESVHLGAYRSMEDHTTFDNVADGFQARVEELLAQGKVPADPTAPAGRERILPFSVDVIAHSTGGPVVRHWLTRYLKNVCDGNFAGCPVQRIVLLAPANFGSRLAAQGQSALAKIFKGGLSHGFQTGRAILQGLELGSPFLCRLADEDLFGQQSVYPVDPKRGPFVFVLSGTKTYEKLKGLVAPGATEMGSDGTVRAAAASLSSVKLKADFRLKPPKIKPTPQPNAPIAFKLVPGKNHTEIVPQSDPNHPVIDIVLRCLAVQDDVGYARISAQFDQENASFYEGERTRPDGVHRFQQFIVRVVDDMDVEVDDYQLAFHVIDDPKVTSTWNEQQPEKALTRYQEYTTRVQERVIVHVQAHSVRPSYRTFFIDLDELAALQVELEKHPDPPFIAMNIDATSPTSGVTFNTDDLHYIPLNETFQDPDGKIATFFAPNTSTLVEVVLKPSVGDDVFKFHPLQR